MVYTLAIEPEMNELGYLIPGVGDVGDRLYNARTPSSSEPQSS